MAAFVHQLHANVIRHMKIGNHIGEPFSGDKGAGQGDTWSLIMALISEKFPEVLKVCVVDDRTLGGPPRALLLLCLPPWNSMS